MALPPKGSQNPLLFSANISSPFDNLEGSALLYPPVSLAASNTEENNESSTKLTPESLEKDISASLQPHLSENSRTSSEKEGTGTSSVISDKTISVVSSAGQVKSSFGAYAPPLPPASSDRLPNLPVGTGNLNLQKPSKRYVATSANSAGTANIHSFIPPPPLGPPQTFGASKSPSGILSRPSGVPTPRLGAPIPPLGAFRPSFGAPTPPLGAPTPPLESPTAPLGAPTPPPGTATPLAAPSPGVPLLPVGPPIPPTGLPLLPPGVTTEHLHSIGTSAPPVGGIPPTSSLQSSLPAFESTVSSRQSIFPSFQFTQAHLGALGVESQSNLPKGNVCSNEHSQKSTVIPASFDLMASNPPAYEQTYHPVFHHWFYSEGKIPLWKPFSFTDSINLEDAFRKGDESTVPTDGGRYDVFFPACLRSPVYWSGDPMPVRRCSWFRRGNSDPVPIPYEEVDANKLENEYRDAMMTNQWHRQVILHSGERVMINSPVSMHHYGMHDSGDFPSSVSINDSQTPKTVMRGTDEFVIQDGCSEQVDHLIFLVHGIGSFCDIKFRSVEECVNDFRAIGEELVATHFKESVDRGLVGRIEILPISWHKALHGDATGLDKKLELITLRSIPKFREFTNDTLLDILFFTSPIYCQHIMDTVAGEMDRLYELFKSRNPFYEGKVSLGGHSLGSVILFDLLMHQKPDYSSHIKVTDDKSCLSRSPDADSITSSINFEIGSAGTGQPSIAYPQLSFTPEALFLMGSPVAMFVTVRGIDNLGPSFELPNCKRVFNIFHPFDPVAYRIETILDTTLTDLRPVLIPHHKGRKRMHLELKDTIERVGSDLKNLVFESLQATWSKVSQFYTGSNMENGKTEKEKTFASTNDMAGPIEYEQPDQNVNVGRLNGGRRVDYVLQEKPYESFTEYVFALQAHLTYWSSEDTMLMILKELYNTMNIASDKPPKTPTSSQNHSPMKVPAPSTHGNFTSPPPSLTPDSLASQSTSPTMYHPPADVPPVPLFTPSSAQVVGDLPIPPLNAASTKPKVVSGRPVFDPMSLQSFPEGGVDPTAERGEANNIAPPPIVSNPAISFSRKQIKK